MKQKLSILNCIVIIYEIVRLVFIFCVRPEFSTQLLPLSWFVSIPLLVFPIIFLALISESPPTFIFLYVLSKAMQVLGIISYILRDYTFALALGASNNYYSLRSLLWLVFFLLIDVILAIVILCINKSNKHIKSNEQNADN